MLTWAGNPPMAILPKKINLRGMRKSWKISYVRSSRKLVLVEYSDQTLVLCGKHYSKRVAIQLITRWVKLKAEAYLPSLFAKLSHRIKINYKKLTISSRRAIWGSCTVGGTISLNYKIIFLPPTIVRHLMLHELCHIPHLNHSKKFWKELEKFDKNWNKNRKELYHAVNCLPEWVIF